MQTHTPGPWQVSLPDETLVLGADRKLVATTLLDEEDYERNYDRRAADARLIASAPDLLAACQRSLSWLTSYPGGCAMPVYDQMRAAIAAATGEQSR